MSTPGAILTQINWIIRHLVEVGLASDQNFPFERRFEGGQVEITFAHEENAVVVRRDRPYFEIYSHLARERAYCVMMPDGALIQMKYLFVNLRLERHWLAFFPAPHLEEFQNNPEIYLEEQIYAEVVSRRIVPFPLRFDYDAREGVFRAIEHPKSHMTLGQYQNCRIPVTAPITPYWFIDFVLRNFYHTAYFQYADRIPRFDNIFDQTIMPSERSIIHIYVPEST